MKRFIALVICGVALSGCAKRGLVYSVQFESKAGEELASGTITLAHALPDTGLVTGRYRLQLREVTQRDSAVEWFLRLFEPKKAGVVEWSVDLSRESASHLLNFMPGLADANILVSARPSKDGILRGTWTYAIAAGGWEGGAARLQKK